MGVRAGVRGKPRASSRNVSFRKTGRGLSAGGGGVVQRGRRGGGSGCTELIGCRKQGEGELGSKVKCALPPGASGALYACEEQRAGGIRWCERTRGAKTPGPSPGRTATIVSTREQTQHVAFFDSVVESVKRSDGNDRRGGTRQPSGGLRRAPSSGSVSLSHLDETRAPNGLNQSNGKQRIPGVSPLPPRQQQYSKRTARRHEKGPTTDIR